VGPTPLILAVITLLTAAVLPAGAETYSAVDGEGTVHYTNTPTDPRYERLGMFSGTREGWLRLPMPDPRRSQVDLTPYLDHIREAAARHGVPERLVSAIIRVESGFNPRAISRKGAQGLMQLMPATASGLGVRNAFDPRQNIDGGVRHLRGLLERLGDDLPLVLAAYNAGEGAVRSHRGIPPYRETQDYVTRIMGLLAAEAPARPAEPGTPPGTAPEPPGTTIHRLVAEDGTVTYTNIPPTGR
jgi:hypothetical protein